MRKKGVLGFFYRDLKTGLKQALCKEKNLTI